MRRRRILLLCVLVLSLSPPSNGQSAVIVLQEALTSQRLSGRVQLGTLPSGVKNVLVEVCDSDWKKSTASTSTDVDGAFSFPALKSKKTYHLRLSMPGANTLLVKVKIKPSGAKELILSLTPAT